MTGDCHWTAGPVPAGTSFVMGDNRFHSGDSTVHLCSSTETDCTGDPYVADDLVVGKVVARIWPFSRLSVLHRPADFADVPDAS